MMDVSARGREPRRHQAQGAALALLKLRQERDPAPGKPAGELVQQLGIAQGRAMPKADELRPEVDQELNGTAVQVRRGFFVRRQDIKKTAGHRARRLLLNRSQRA